MYLLKFVVGVFNWFIWLFFGIVLLVDGVMIYFVDFVKFFVDFVYYVLIDIISNIRLEIYMGILMIVLFYGIFVYVVIRLYSWGYIFFYFRIVN